MILTNNAAIKGIYPHKGQRCFKRVNPFGTVEWLPVKEYKAAQCYSDSYLTVPPTSVHPDDLPAAKRTGAGKVILNRGLRLISDYKVAVHDGHDSSVYTITPPKNGLTIEAISYGNAHVAHTVWYTDGTEWRN